jgi:succinate dehydrogenase/fumarate reductase-like Fe-S protein
MKNLADMTDEEYRQAQLLHEDRQAEDPEHEQCVSCFCCCWSCDLIHDREES